jgi:hypothetical protein
MRALGAIARLAAGPVALVVLAYPSGGPIRVHGMVGERRPLWPIAAICSADLDIDAYAEVLSR